MESIKTAMFLLPLTPTLQCCLPQSAASDDAEVLGLHAKNYKPLATNSMNYKIFIKCQWCLVAADANTSVVDT